MENNEKVFAMFIRDSYINSLHIHTYFIIYKSTLILLYLTEVKIIFFG